MSIFQELKRRNVFKVATAYVVTAWIAIQVVSAVAPFLKIPDWVGTSITLVFVIFFPLAVILAWAYEVTPEGIKRSHHVELDESISHITGRKIDFTIIALLLMALIYNYTVKPEPSLSEKTAINTETTPTTVSSNAKIDSTTTPVDASQDEITSIAVLPFVNMSSDTEQEYFSDGLTEELLNVLAKIEKLRVAARTSSFHFKGKNLDIREVAEKLNVDHILEGSVRKSGNQVRITAQLIKASSGYHMWSGTYDYELKDIFKIQDEISQSVVQQLRINLLDLQLEQVLEHGTKNIAAQDAYLLGRYYMRDRTPEKLSKAEVAFSKAIAVDPNYQSAISGLLDTLSLQVDYAGLPNAQYIARASTLLAPFAHKEQLSAELLTSQGMFERTQGNYQQAEALYLQAIAKNPNYVQAHHWAFTNYILLGKAELAKRYLQQALTLDPYAPVLITNASLIEMITGNYLLAEEYAKRGIEIAPNMPSNYIRLLDINWQYNNRVDLAWQLIKQSHLAFSYDWSNAKIGFYLSLGYWQIAEQEVTLLEQHQPKNYNTHFARAWLQYYKLTHNIGENLDHASLIDQNNLDNNIAEHNLVSGWAALLVKDYRRCRSAIEHGYPEIIQADFKITFDTSHYAASLLAFCHQQTGSTVLNALAKKLLIKAESVRQMMTREDSAEMFARLYLLNDNKVAAINALAELVESNSSTKDLWALAHDPWYSSLHNEPEFQRLLVIVNQRIKAQQQQIIKLKAQQAKQLQQAAR